jgi:hypothetical protein
MQGMGGPTDTRLSSTTTATVPARSRQVRRSRLARLGFAAIIASLTLLVTACGGRPPDGDAARLGSTTTSATQGGSVTGATDKFAAWLAYARCMRSRGVPNFPDPTQVDGGIQISGSQAGLDPHSPAFMAAEQSCRHLQPSGSQLSNTAYQQRELDRMLRLSRCIRAHHITGFPDATLSAPYNRGDYSVITSNGVAWLAIPKSIDIQSPAFKHAASACRLPLP